jgi:hypothetical protein
MRSRRRHAIQLARLLFPISLAPMYLLYVRRMSCMHALFYTENIISEAHALHHHVIQTSRVWVWEFVGPARLASSGRSRRSVATFGDTWACRATARDTDTAVVRLTTRHRRRHAWYLRSRSSSNTRLPQRSPCMHAVAVHHQQLVN